MDPEVIMSIIVALIILAVGIFAFLVAMGSMPVTAPAVNNVAVSTGNVSINDTNTTEFLPIVSTYRNSTSTYQLCTLEAYGKYGGAKGWWTVQAPGSINGSFLSNNTYQVDAGTVHRGIGGTVSSSRNISFRLTYYKLGSVTSSLDNKTYYNVVNVTSTGDQVFNIIGIVMIISAIMTIIGLVYFYVRPKQ